MSPLVKHSASNARGNDTQRNAAKEQVEIAALSLDMRLAPNERLYVAYVQTFISKTVKWGFEG
jgi:hypothetical protein